MFFNRGGRMTQRIAIVDGIRTPFCKAGGGLKGVGADDLGALAVRELLARTSIDPGLVDEVVFGCVAQPADAMNTARVLALKAGLPNETIAHTVQRNCASGMQAVTTAAMQLQSGESEIVIAGGTESMSRYPLLFGPKMTNLFMKMMRAKTARQKLSVLSSFRPSFLQPIIALQLGLTDSVCGLNMGQTAEVLASEFGITRAQQDRFALESHRRALAAIESGRFDDEVMPVVAAPAYDDAVRRDDGPRAGQTIEALQKLRPYFDRHAGTVTVGNACPVTDGAAALLMCTEEKARELGLRPLGYLSGWAYAALDGDRMGLGPAYATARLLDRVKLRVRDFDRVEINEAFAAQVIANERAFASDAFAQQYLGRSKALGELDRERLNVNGGAIALGHPVGATGARLVLTVLKELELGSAQRGLATLCIGGGQGAAVALEAA